MSRRPVLTPEGITRIRKDPRYVAAVSSQGLRDADWRSKGQCRHTDPETFFPDVTSEQARALAVCGGCPVQGLCLMTAIEGAEPEGVWGGTSPRERRVMRAVFMLPKPCAAEVREAS